MTFKKSFLLALAFVVPLTLLLWLTFSPVLFFLLYPGVMAQVAITAASSNVQGALLGLVCGAAVNTLLYSAAILVVARIKQNFADKHRKPHI